MDLATKQAVRKKHFTEPQGAMFRIKAKIPRTDTSGIWLYEVILGCFFIHMMCDVFALLSDCLNVVAFYLCSWEQGQWYNIMVLSSSYFQGVKHFTILAQDNVGKNVFFVYIFCVYELMKYRLTVIYIFQCHIVSTSRLNNFCTNVIFSDRFYNHNSLSSSKCSHLKSILLSCHISL